MFMCSALLSCVCVFCKHTFMHTFFSFQAATHMQNIKQGVV